MSARRYGPQDGQPPQKMTDYHQSKDELAGLPVTVAEKIPVTNTPNIFSYKSYVFAKNPALVQRYIKATKADGGGVGGHVVAADAFTGNLRGAGPATVALPFPVRKDNASQTVLVSFADKTEPMAFNHYATGAYMLPRFNTGLVIAASKMKRGYVFEIVDLDTKAQAVEAGAHPRDQRALDNKMEEVAKGLQEKVITLRAPEDLYDIEGLTR